MIKIVPINVRLNSVIKQIPINVNRPISKRIECSGSVTVTIIRAIAQVIDVRISKVNTDIL